MKLELALFCIALVPALLRTLIGWQRGAAIEIRECFVTLFSVLAALRYWHPVSIALTGMLGLRPSIAAGAAFLGLFLAAAALASFAVHLGGKQFQSVQTNYPDKVLGSLLGLFSGALLGGSLILVATVAFSGGSLRLDPAALPARLDRLPAAAFRLCEKNLAGIQPDTPAATSLPTAIPAEPETSGGGGPKWD